MLLLGLFVSHSIPIFPSCSLSSLPTPAPLCHPIWVRDVIGMKGVTGISIQCISFLSVGYMACQWRSHPPSIAWMSVNDGREETGKTSPTSHPLASFPIPYPNLWSLHVGEAMGCHTLHSLYHLTHFPAAFARGNLSMGEHTWWRAALSFLYSFPFSVCPFPIIHLLII